MSRGVVFLRIEILSNASGKLSRSNHQAPGLIPTILQVLIHRLTSFLAALTRGERRVGI
jgi:hypothetical protein